jgi:hypothetical protein
MDAFLICGIILLYLGGALLAYSYSRELNIEPVLAFESGVCWPALALILFVVFLSFLFLDAYDWIKVRLT